MAPETKSGSAPHPDPGAAPPIPVSPLASLDVAITALCDQLSTGAPPFDSPEYQKLKDDRDALTRKQQDLARKEFQTDDATFQQASTDLKKATDALNDEIKSTQNIDKIIGIISEISASADELIKAV
jgi:hypothetical protein